MMSDEDIKEYHNIGIKRVFCIGNGESRKGFDLEKLRQHGTIYGCNAIYRDFLPDSLISVDNGIMHEIYHAGIGQKIPCYFRNWTKCPSHMYDTLLYSSMNEEDRKAIKEFNLHKENDKNNATEFVMNGSSLNGMARILRTDKTSFMKQVNHTSVYISWIQENDKSQSLTDLFEKDEGWAAGSMSGNVAVKVESPNEVYLIGHDLRSTTKKVNNLYKGTEHYVAADHHPTPAANWIKQWKTLFTRNPSIKFYKVNRLGVDANDGVNQTIEEWKGVDNLSYVDYSTLDNLVK